MTEPKQPTTEAPPTDTTEKFEQIPGTDLYRRGGQLYHRLTDKMYLRLDEVEPGPAYVVALENGVGRGARLLREAHNLLLQADDDAAASDDEELAIKIAVLSDRIDRDLEEAHKCADRLLARLGVSV